MKVPLGGGGGGGGVEELGGGGDCDCDGDGDAASVPDNPSLREHRRVCSSACERELKSVNKELTFSRAVFTFSSCSIFPMAISMRLSSACCRAASTGQERN